MKLAVVTSSPPAVEGGHLVIARALVASARQLGIDASLVVTPDFGFGRTARTYAANRIAKVGEVDRVISLRYPSYAVQHPAQVCWLNHTMREYYDLWPQFAATLSVLNGIKERTRRALIHAADNYLLTHNVREVVAQSVTIRERLKHDFKIDAAVLYPPPPPRAYHCDRYDSFIFTASRLVPLKRVDLMIRALAEPAAQNVRLVIGGTGESAADLKALANQCGVVDRVTFAGQLNDDALVGYLARCRAVAYTPFAEDYGFLASEAFACRKPVVTCRDSGGPTELVEHEISGLVTDPTPQTLASAFESVSSDASLAERLGGNGHERLQAITWPTVIQRLTTS